MRKGFAWGLILISLAIIAPVATGGLSRFSLIMPVANAQEKGASDPAEQTPGETAAKPRIGKGVIGLEILKDVEERNLALDEREQELDRREQRIVTLQSDLEKQISELRALQAKIEESVKMRNDLEEDSVQRLAKTFASMPPETAASMIAKMDFRIAVRVLSVMKERSVGKILAATPTEFASRMSEGLVKRGSP